MLLLGNFGQQMDIEDQQREISDLRHEIARLRRSERTPADLSGRVDQLERELDETRLYLAALIRYLGRSGSLNQAEFARLVDVVDRQDGAADGGYRGPMTG